MGRSKNARISKLVDGTFAYSFASHGMGVPETALYLAAGRQRRRPSSLLPSWYPLVTRFCNLERRPWGRSCCKFCSWSQKSYCARSCLVSLKFLRFSSILLYKYYSSYQNQTGPWFLNSKDVGQYLLMSELIEWNKIKWYWRIFLVNLFIYFISI